MAEAMIKGDDVEQFSPPEIRFVIPDDQWDLFGDQQDSNRHQHSFDDR